VTVSQHGCRSLFLLILVSINLIHHEYDLTPKISDCILGIISLTLLLIYTRTSVRYKINVILLYSIVYFSLINRNHDIKNPCNPSQSYEGKFRIEVIDENIAINNGFKYHKVKMVNVPATLAIIEGKCLVVKLKMYYELKKDNIYDIAGVVRFFKSAVKTSSIVFNRINYLKKIKNKHFLRDSFCNRINHSKLSQDCKNFIFAFLIGDKSHLSDNQFDTFRASGTMHLFAVSGLHVGCVYSILYFCVQFLLRDNKLIVIISLAVLWIYVDLVGYSVSSVRACLMITAWCIARVVQKRTSALYIMVLSMIFCVAEDSLDIRSLAFQLSFTVVLTIIWLCSLKVTTNHYSLIKSFFRNLALVGYGSYWGSFLLVLDHFDLILTFSYFINLILIPFIALIMIILLLYLVSLYILNNDMVYFIVDYIYNLIFTYLKISSELPYSVINVKLEINDCLHLVYFFTILFFFYRFKTTKAKLLFLPVFGSTAILLSILLSWFS
tara:strand:- start:162 stop:1646 length:1485 start_codon:yes stop_codon:yes gene_type:complete